MVRRPPRVRHLRRRLFWLHPTNQLLWHIHRSSSILFCVLVCLNMLAGVVPFSSEENNLEEELRKNVVTSSNNTVEEDELAREILKLFDYEDNWIISRTESNKKHDNFPNETNSNSSGIGQNQLQFSTDSMVEVVAENGTYKVSAENVTHNAISNGTDQFDQLNQEMNQTLGGEQNIDRKGNEIEKMIGWENDQSGGNSTRSSTTSTTEADQSNVTMDTISSDNNTMATIVVNSTTEISEFATSSPTPFLPYTEKQQTVTQRNNETTTLIYTMIEANGTTLVEMEENSHNVTTVTMDDTILTTTEEETKHPENILNSTITTVISQSHPSTSIGNYSITEGEKSSTVPSSPTVVVLSVNETENSTSTAKKIEIEVYNNSTTYTNYTEDTTSFTTVAGEIGQLATNASNETEMVFNKTNITTVSISEINTSTQPTTTNSTTEESNRLEGFGTVVGEEAVKTMLEELKKRVERRLGLGAAELVELTEYRQHLQQMLTSVELALTKLPTQLSDFPKSQRFIDISPSLPNRNSELFIDRKNALAESELSSSSNKEDIRKSPAKGLTSEPMASEAASTTQPPQQVISVTEPTAVTATVAPTTTEPTNGTQTAFLAQPPTEPSSNAVESLLPNAAPASSEGESEERSANNPRETGFFRAESFASKYFPFNPFRNNSAEHCKHLSQEELVKELKYKGNYNPDLMAWDVGGVFRFLDKTIMDQYERQFKPPKSSEQAVKRNVEALERLLAELNLRCDLRSPEVMSRMENLTMHEAEPKRSIISSSLRDRASILDQLIRYKRNSVLAEQLVHQTLNSSQQHQRKFGEVPPPFKNKGKKQKMIGDVHLVPFGCDKRGGSEDGYLRLCGACQAIRKLPEEYFPPFINEVMCDEDKACLYFYDYPHGKCKQKHMNFVVLRNVGTQLCQVWEKFNLNVRVSCECFVDEMSFFSKYV